MSARPYVFVIDDNPADRELVLTVFEETGIVGEHETFPSGKAALARLGQLAATGARLPDAILLDLNMPAMSGFEVLAALKGDAALRDIRVLVLTTSSSPLDRARCRELGADGFLVKPTTFTGLANVLSAALAGDAA